MDPSTPGTASSPTGAGSSHNLEDALRIVACNGFEISELPTNVNDEKWTMIRHKCNLSSAQTAALKNFKNLQSWNSKSNVDTVMIGEDFSQSASNARDLNNCLLNVSGEISVREAIFGRDCLLDLLISRPSLLPEEFDGTRDALTGALDSMIDEHSSWIILEGANPGTTAANISFDHKLVLRLYTANEPLPLYTVVNKVLNSQDREIAGLSFILPFMKLLFLAAEALGADIGFRCVGAGYRGLKINVALQGKIDNKDTVFAVDKLLTLAAFTSISTIESRARRFGDRLFFKIVNIRGVDLQSLSVFPEEKEVLVLPPAVFKVVRCNEAHNALTVVMTHCDQPSASYIGRPCIPSPTANCIRAAHLVALPFRAHAENISLRSLHAQNEPKSSASTYSGEVHVDDDMLSSFSSVHINNEDACDFTPVLKGQYTVTSASSCANAIPGAGWKIQAGAGAGVAAEASAGAGVGAAVTAGDLIPLDALNAQEVAVALLACNQVDFVQLFQYFMPGPLLQQCDTKTLLNFKKCLFAALAPGYGPSGRAALEQFMETISDSKFRELKNVVKAWQDMGVPSSQ